MYAFYTNYSIMKVPECLTPLTLFLSALNKLSRSHCSGVLSFMRDENLKSVLHINTQPVINKVVLYTTARKKKKRGTQNENRCLSSFA